MKTSDRYHKWVEWSDEDQTYLGKCPDLITGIQGDDPRQLYADLCEVVYDVIGHFETEGRPLPPPRVRPMQGGHLVHFSHLCVGIGRSDEDVQPTKAIAADGTATGGAGGGNLE